MSLLIGVGDFGVGDLVEAAETAANAATTAAEQVADATGQLAGQVGWRAAEAEFASTVADRIAFDGSIWERKTGSKTPNSGVILAGPAGSYYQRQFEGPLKISYFKGLVTAGDWKPAIDAAMTWLNSQANSEKGGEIWFDNWIYETSTIVMQSRITFVSAGRGVGIIRLKAGTNADVVQVPNTAWFCSLRSITIDGNKASNTAGSGLYIEGALDSDGHNQNQIWDKNITGSSSYTYFRADNIAVTSCAGEGIVIPGRGGVGGNYICYFHDIITEYNNSYGFFNRSTDNMFSAIIAEKNGRTGIYEAGSNNKWTGVKSIWNGINPTFRLESAGIRVLGQRNMFTQCETQDNYHHGYWVQGVDNMFINCLADGNGYVSPENLLGNGFTFGWFVNGAVAPVFANCKASNYVGLGGRAPVPDGRYIQERGYVIDAGSRNVQGQIDANPNHNQIPLNQANPTRNAPLLLCFRATTVTLDANTFAPGQPVLSGAGLSVSELDRIIIPETIDLQGSMSVSLDMMPTVLPGTITRLLDSEGLGLVITYVNDGSTGAPRLDFALMIGGIRKAVAITDYPLVMNRKYRLAMKARVVNTTLWFYALVSYLEEGGVIQRKTQQAISTIAAGAVFDPIRNLTINGAGDKVQGIYQKLLISTDVLHDGQLLAGTDYSERIPVAGLYANFNQFRKPQGLYITPATGLPQASEYYRGVQIFQRSGSFSDYAWRCIKRTDGTYTWHNELLMSRYTNSGKPTTGNWDNGTILWNGAPALQTANNGAKSIVSGWQNIGGTAEGFQPLTIPIGDQNLIGNGPQYPTTTEIGSAYKYLFWRRIASGVDQMSIWYSQGSGVLRAIVPIGGKQIITGDGLQILFSIPHTLPYEPSVIQLSGIPHKNIVVDEVAISFTLMEPLADGDQVAVYWTAR